MASKKKVTKVTKSPAKKTVGSGAVYSQEIVVPEGTEEIRLQLKVRCKKGKCCCPKVITLGISPIEPEEPGGSNGSKKRLLGASPIEPEEPGGG